MRHQPLVVARVEHIDIAGLRANHRLHVGWKFEGLFDVSCKIVNQIETWKVLIVLFACTNNYKLLPCVLMSFDVFFSHIKACVQVVICRNKVELIYLQFFEMVGKNSGVSKHLQLNMSRLWRRFEIQIVTHPTPRQAQSKTSPDAAVLVCSQQPRSLAASGAYSTVSAAIRHAGHQNLWNGKKRERFSMQKSSSFFRLAQNHWHYKPSSHTNY